ncbi:glycoside hydrolase family 17 [Purpureocillium lilacinum]|uniref:Probable beta-glucosidase btgE n=1 Tax=Purpureocillium lilacinum TaxID=33203 RepID=A0A179HQA6_PURLI|nr:glycoside hydrolase family 17 [Purpureocillium lilacinum]OAQ91610.1 glycoside hydrolase family 17 [Purpureocillium lilacinum]
MKGVFAAAALAAMAGSVSAAHHRHAHEALFAKRGNDTADVCVPGCTTIWKTITGEPTLVPISTVTATSTKTSTVTRTQTPTQAPPATTEVVVVPLPTPQPRTCPTPGTYTFPATTLTVTQTTTVCGAETTQVPPGTHTVGGVTTIVKTATTVVCPVATVQTTGGVTTSTIVQTTYVCPTPGTYTIAPTTHTVTESTVLVYPVPSTITPGTYTAPAQVITVTKTGYVTYCPFTPETPKPSSSPKTPTGSIGSDNDHFGITYTPYEPTNGQCKDATKVSNDIAALKKAGFTTVRVYSTDCNTLETVGSACKTHGMGMIVGVFVKGGCTAETPDIKEQIDKLGAWDGWNMVKLVVVGNEAIMNGHCSASQLVTLIKTVKSIIPGGYKDKIPCTISETLDVWQRKEVSSALCSEIGIVGANVHPYFNAAVTPEKAGDFVSNQLSLLAKICPGKDAINLECGWPNNGKCNGAACPGKSEQAKAITSIRKSCGSKTVFFSFEDDQWKEPGECECERSWGSAAAFSINIDISL